MSCGPSLCYQESPISEVHNGSWSLFIGRCCLKTDSHAQVFDLLINEIFEMGVYNEDFQKESSAPKAISFFSISSLIDISLLRKFWIVFLKLLLNRRVWLLLCICVLIVCVCARALLVTCIYGYLKGMGQADHWEEQRKPRKGMGHLAQHPPTRKKKIGLGLVGQWLSPTTLTPKVACRDNPPPIEAARKRCHKT